MAYFIRIIYVVYTSDMVQDFSGILSHNFIFKAFYLKATVLYWQEKNIITIMFKSKYSVNSSLVTVNHISCPSNIHMQNYCS